VTGRVTCSSLSGKWGTVDNSPVEPLCWDNCEWGLNVEFEAHRWSLIGLGKFCGCHGLSLVGFHIRSLAGMFRNFAGVSTQQSIRATPRQRTSSTIFAISYMGPRRKPR
jgi:hypothetical protein